MSEDYWATGATTPTNCAKATSTVVSHPPLLHGRFHGLPHWEVWMIEEAMIKSKPQRSVDSSYGEGRLVCCKNKRRSISSIETIMPMRAESGQSGSDVWE